MRKIILVICMMLLLVYLPTFVSGDIDATIGEGYSGYQRAIARASDGTLYSVYRNSTSTMQIICSVSIDNGSTWTDTILVDAELYQSSPTIAIDSNDVVYVFWDGAVDELLQHSVIRFCYYDGSWSSVYNFTSSEYDDYSSAIAVNSSDCVHVVWLYSEDGDIQDVMTGWFDYYTDTISTPELIDTGNIENPTIAIDENDVIHVAWDDTIFNEQEELLSIQIKYSYNDGSWSEIYNVTELDLNRECQFPSIVVDGSTVHFTWTASLFVENVFANITYQYRSFNVSFGDMKDIYVYDADDENIYICSLSRDADNLYAVFDGEGERGPCLYYSTYDGDAWGSPVFIKDVISYGNPNLIFAQYPIVSGAETNVPETGFAFTYVNVTEILQGPTVNYYSNATWQEQQYGDPTTFPDAKMTNPQYPDPYGWDVDLATQVYLTLADDWVCSETGYISDIHFWVSSYNDVWGKADILHFMEFYQTYLYIYSDDSTGDYSHPDELLYSTMYGNSEKYFDVSVSGPYLGDEGWLSPPDTYAEHNHQLFYRVDLTNFSYQFIQQNSTTYWLGIKGIVGNPNYLGLKTSTNHYMDNATYNNGTDWYPLTDPLTQGQIDFAFVIGGLPFEYGDPTTFPDAKMHFPQYPDPLGWDVGFNNNYAVLTDDWQCNATGPITGIHFWVSTQEDSLGHQEILDILNNMTLSIWSNNPPYYHESYEATYSDPNEELWVYDDSNILLSGPYLGDEGWLNPMYDEWDYQEHDHQLFWRVDIENISDPFIQINGTIYWLYLCYPDGQLEGLGWKTTETQFMDGAVFKPYGYYPVYDPLTNETLDLAFVITGEEFGDPTTFPDAKMTNPQYPDPFGWDVDFTPFIADDWQCSESGNVTDIHLWVSSESDQLTREDIESAFGKDMIPNSHLAMAIFSNNATLPSHPDSILWMFDGNFMTCDINISGPFYGDEGWFTPEDWSEEHNHQLFWRVDIINFSSPFYQEEGTIYWLLVQPIPTSLGWKTSQDHFMDNAVYSYDFVNWYPLEDPETQEPLDFAFVITGELAPLPSFNTTYYVNTSFNSGTPGWHVTHWDNIQDAVDNCTGASYNYTILVDGDGNIYNENVEINTTESYNTLNLIGNYTTLKPEVIGQDSYRSTIQINSNWVNLTGFNVSNPVHYLHSYHCIAIGGLEGDYYNITINECDVWDGTDGVAVKGAYNTVENCKIWQVNTGISIMGVIYENTYDVIKNNDISDYVTGISVSYSENIHIFSNIISDGNTGVEIWTISDNNYVYYNNITDNDLGIKIGGYLTGNNWVYNNNFVSNTDHAEILGGGTNYWNLSYPYCGNYYSSLSGNDDYRGPNQDIPSRDGIRDTQYTIETNNTDYYPFISPFDGTYPSLGYSYITSEHPANNSEYVLVEADMSVMVGDENLENVDVYFFWANGTLINSVNNVPSNSVASFKILDYYTMSHGTTYSWYVTFVNSTGGMTSPIWSFTTCRAYDLNGDGTINYLDVSALVSHYGDTIPQDIQETFLRPIGDGLATWTRSPPAPANFLLVMETIPDDPMTFVWANPPAGSPELYLIGTPSYTYSIINVTLNARMCSVAGGDLFQHCIWDGFGAPSYGPPMPTLTMFPIFQTYSFTWSSDPYGGAWTWAGLSVYMFGVDQSFVGLVSPTMMTQFYLDVLYNIPGSQPYDINGDGIVNYLDVSSLVSHYGESY